MVLCNKGCLYSRSGSFYGTQRFRENASNLLDCISDVNRGGNDGPSLFFLKYPFTLYFQEERQEPGRCRPSKLINFFKG